MVRLKKVLQAHGYRGTREYDAGLPSDPDFLRFVCDAAGVTLAGGALATSRHVSPRAQRRERARTSPRWSSPRSAPTRGATSRSRPGLPGAPWRASSLETEPGRRSGRSSRPALPREGWEGLCIVRWPCRLSTLRWPPHPSTVGLKLVRKRVKKPPPPARCVLTDR